MSRRWMYMIIVVIAVVGFALGTALASRPRGGGEKPVRYDSMGMPINEVGDVAYATVYITPPTPFDNVPGWEMTATQLCFVTADPNGVMLYRLFGTPTANSYVTPTPEASPTVSLANAQNGAQLFSVKGCSACHSVRDSMEVVGPSLKGIAVRADEKQAGIAAEAYIRGVILDPNLAIPNNKPYIMPNNYSYTLTPSELNDIVAYLMTLTD